MDGKKCGQTDQGLNIQHTINIRPAAAVSAPICSSRYYCVMMRTGQSLLCLALAAVFISAALADLPSDADCKSAYFSMGQDAMWVRLLLCLDPTSALSATWPHNPLTQLTPHPASHLNAGPGLSKQA